MLTEMFPDTRVISFSYDPNGNLTSVTPPGSSQHSFLYNAMELIQSYIPPALGGMATNTTYSYNLDKQLTTVTRPDGQTVNYNYASSTGLLTNVNVGTSTTRSLAYQSSTPLVSSASVTDGVSNLNYNFTYYGTKIASEQQLDSSSNPLTKISFGFDNKIFSDLFSN